MDYTTGLSYGQAGIGAAKSLYGAYSTGRMYDAEALAYERNTKEAIERNEASFRIRESAKDQAGLGASIALDAYLYDGGKKLESIEGQLADINAQTLMQQSIAYEQSLAVDEAVGNMMSRNAVDAMKAEARLRVGVASSGAEGSTSEVVISEARSVEMFDNAVVIGRANSQKLNINRRLSMERISAMNKKKGIASQMSNVMGAQGAGAAYQAGYVKAYQGMSKSMREGYISYDKIQAEDTSTWIDDVIVAYDILENSGAMSEINKAFKSKDENGTFDAYSGKSKKKSTSDNFEEDWWENF